MEFLKNSFKKVVGAFKNFYYPPNIDIAYRRRDLLSKLYVGSAFLLFVLASVDLGISMASSDGDQFRVKLNEGANFKHITINPWKHELKIEDKVVKDGKLCEVNKSEEVEDSVTSSE